MCKYKGIVKKNKSLKKSDFILG